MRAVVVVFGEKHANELAHGHWRVVLLNDDGFFVQNKLPHPLPQVVGLDAEADEQKPNGADVWRILVLDQQPDLRASKLKREQFHEQHKRSAGATLRSDPADRRVETRAGDVGVRARFPRCNVGAALINLIDLSDNGGRMTWGKSVSISKSRKISWPCPVAGPRLIRFVGSLGSVHGVSK